MTTLDRNIELLKNWNETYPESFRGFNIENENIVFNGNKINISKYELTDLIASNPLFVDQLSTLAPNDVFKIINLHVMLLGSGSKNLSDDNKDKGSEDKLQKLQNYDPVMNNVSIFYRKDNNSIMEYFSVVDGKGKTHIFHNDRNVELVVLYSKISLEGKNVTPGSLVDTFNRYLHEVPLISSTDLIENSKISESFTNKMRSLEANYNGNNMIRIYGNQDHDISVIENEAHPEETIINTYKKNEYGDLIAESHGNNMKNNNNSYETKSDDELKDEIQKEEKIKLIPFDTFMSRIDSIDSFTKEQENEMNLWYSVLGDILTYIDLVDPRIKSYYEKYKFKIEMLEMNRDDGQILNDNQQTAIDRYNEMYNKRFSSKEKSNSQSLEDVKKLTLELNNAGNIDFIQIIWIVMGVLTILTALTIYFVC